MSDACSRDAGQETGAATGSAVAGDRAAHAARAAAARAELGAGDPDDLDAGLLEAGVGLVVALVGDGDPRREGQGVVAVVPLLALGGDRVEAGVDLVQRVDAHRLGGRDQERLGVGDVQHQVARRSRRRSLHRDGVAPSGVPATLGYITILSTSTIVQTVSRCMVARSWAIGTASTVCARSSCEDLAGQPLDARPASSARRRRRRSRPAPSSSTSPPSTCSWCQPWIVRVPAKRGCRV